MGWITLRSGEVPANASGASNNSGVQYNSDSFQYDAANNRWSCDFRVYLTNQFTGTSSYGTDRKACWVRNDISTALGQDTQIVYQGCTSKDTFYTGAGRLYGYNNSRSIPCYSTVRNTGYSSWSNNNGTWDSSGDVSSAAIPASPTITSFTTDNITRTGFRINVSANPGSGASLSSYQYSLDNGVTWNAGSSSVTLTTLAANTSYSVKVKAIDNFGQYSISSAIVTTTSGNAPVLSGVGINTLGITSVIMTYSAAYDTNAALSTYKWEYGTTVSYGSEIINSNNISGLTQATEYFYKLTVTDTWNRSSVFTGSFVTEQADAPVISNVTTTEIAEYSISLSVTATPGDGTIESYEFSKDNGVTWTEPSTSNTYTFDTLNDDTNYNIKVRVQNSYNIITTSDTITIKTLSAGICTLLKSDGSVTKVNGYILKSDGTVTRLSKSNIHILNP